ncbi:MAG TPA: hypothetical protein VMU84_16610 [Thermoanaerobaculia bacterium]|nr:hypothetical protein [Thermoanaerobaculia bacterium]
MVRVASTHLVFAQTLDEPIHVAAGHEWLTRGTYQLDFEHPPLSRMLFALPFLDVRAQHSENQEYGNDLFARDDRYIHNLAAARRGNLVFLIIASLAVAAIARKLFGDVVAWIALALFVSLPPVLAHAGLATTDMASTAGFAVALYALLIWIDGSSWQLAVRPLRDLAVGSETIENPLPDREAAELPTANRQPSWKRTILLGIAIAFGACCKYSFLFFFPPAVLIVLIARRRFPIAKLLVAGALSAIVIWGVFGFSIATMASVNPKAQHMARTAGVSERILDVRVPAPDFLLGLLTVKAHNRAGHSAFLLGKVKYDGWWYYFPIALVVKTPIPFLILAACGAWLLLKRRDPAIPLLLIAAAILGISMSARINIGIRHLLPMYVPLAIVAASFVTRAKLATYALLGWLVITSALAHPDYLPWMNAFAGKHPEQVLADSNFDWGQDIWRLVRLCKSRGIRSLGYKVTTNIRGASVGITTGYPLDENQPSRGWMVLGDQDLELAKLRNPTAFDWLTRNRDFERFGKTLRLYHVE